MYQATTVYVELWQFASLGLGVPPTIQLSAWGTGLQRRHVPHSDRSPNAACNALSPNTYNPLPASLRSFALIATGRL